LKQKHKGKKQRSTCNANKGYHAAWPQLSQQQQPTMTWWRTTKLMTNSILLHMKRNYGIVHLHAGK